MEVLRQQDKSLTGLPLAEPWPPLKLVFAQVVQTHRLRRGRTFYLQRGPLSQTACDGAPLTLSDGEEEAPEHELPGLDEHQRHEDSDSARTPWA